MKTFPGDRAQSFVSRADYIPQIQQDKPRGSDASTSFTDVKKPNGMTLRDNGFEQLTDGLSSDPSFAPFTSISSNSIGNILEPENTVPSDLLALKNVLTGTAGSSQSLQSNWQVLNSYFYYICR